MATGRKQTTVVASGIEVLCPFCGEPQPSPGNGSFIWLSEELATVALDSKRANRQCVSCDVDIRVVAPARVGVVYPAGFGVER